MIDLSLNYRLLENLIEIAKKNCRKQRKQLAFYLFRFKCNTRLEQQQLNSL